MRVKVTDSFGSTYFFELVDEVLEIEQIDHVLELNPNAWYQFKVKDMPLTEKDKNNGYYFDEDENKMVFDEYWEPSFTGEQCIDWSWQLPYRLIDDYSWNSDLLDCKTNLRSGNAYDSMQVFKPTKNGMKSGYDEDYSWGIDSLIKEYFTIRPVKNNKNSFTPILSEVINGKAYYSFTNGKKCVSAKDWDAGYTNIFIESCTGEGNQLFEAIQVEGDFGALSMEKDVTPPDAPSNVFLEIDDYSSLALLSWDKVEDRGMETIYEVYEYTLQDNYYELIETIYGTDRTVLIYTDEMEEGDTTVYAIRAMDETGKYSPYSPLIFKKQEGVKDPTKPTILNVAPDGTSITLKLPKYDTSKIQGVRVYDGDNYLGTYVGPSVTLSTASGNKHEFTYRFEIKDQIFSQESNKLKTTIP